ncbi:MAG TPA: dihydrodipicolinate synthase family protein [Acidimicrobiales bacterium]|jgi:4-hydroxy-tetrahydrodipicolinate synthase
MPLTAPRPVNAMSVTPLDSRDRLDHDAVAVVVDHLSTAGVGIYLGSYGTGEGHLLRPSEIDHLYRLAVEVAAGRVPVYAAALGFTSTDEVIEAALAAVDAGVDAVQIHPPRPGPVAILPRPAELERFYADVLGAVTIPVHLTNQVVMVGYALPVQLVTELLDSYDQITAVNTSDPDLGRVAQLINAVGRRTDVYVGIVAQLGTALALGGAGTLCFEADVAPELCGAVVDAHQAGDTDRLSSLFADLLRLNEVLSRLGHPRSVKAAMRLLGLPAGALRRPYLELDAHEVDDLAAALGELGLLNR